MRTHSILERTLGVLWLVYCGSYGVFMLWEICHVFAISQPQNEDSIWLRVMSLSVVICLLYFAGAVASVFLFRGASWARKFVGVIAIISVLLVIANWSFDFWAVVQGAFAFVSACCLFFPRRLPSNKSLQATAAAPTGRD